MKQFQEQLQTLANAYQVQDPPISPWQKYCELVMAVNQQTNLVGSKTQEELVEVLFADALQLLRSGWLHDLKNAVDIGAGVGAPLIPVAMACPKLRVTLVEARRRRVAFLRRAIGELALAQQIQVREETLDKHQPTLEGAPFDVALSRATWRLDVWLEIGSALAQRVIAFTTEPPESLPNSPLKLVECIEYVLPNHGSTRALSLYSR